MNPSTTHPASEQPVDADLAEQTNPGHGIPSQDPTAAAQVALNDEEAERESKSAMMGGGIIAGAAAGAAIGVAVAGPVGVLVGSTLGAVSVALGGGAAGALMDSDTSSSNADAPQGTADSGERIPPR